MHIRISSELAEMDLSMIHRFLTHESYWAKGIAFEPLRKGLENSLCFGLFVDGEQAAFGRAVTDYASFGYLKDIFVLPRYRGLGYGKQLVAAMLARLDQEGIGGLMLATTDAHGLYRAFGFELIEGSEKVMRRSLGAAFRVRPT